MNAIEKLEAIGYIFSLSESGIRYQFNGEKEPSNAGALLQTARAHRKESEFYIRKREYDRLNAIMLALLEEAFKRPLGSDEYKTLMSCINRMQGIFNQFDEEEKKKL